MKILELIFYIFVKIQLSHNKNITLKELKQLKGFSKAGILISIFNLIPFIIFGVSTDGIILSEGNIFFNVLCVLISIVVLILQIKNLKKIKHLIENTNIEVVEDNIEEDTPNRQNESCDLYALIITLSTLPMQIFIYLTNVSKTERPLSGAWSSTVTEYRLPSDIRSIMIIISIASAIGSMYLILHKGKNHSNTATWVKILNIINIIGEIIILSI